MSEELVQLESSTATITQVNKKLNKKKVSFSADTYFSDEYNISASILSHAYLKEAGHTVYTIKVSEQNYIFIARGYFIDSDLIVFHRCYLEEMNGHL